MIVHMNEYNNKKEGEKLTVHDIDCCDTYQVHDDLLKTVNEKMPEESELRIWQTFLRSLEILQGSGFCLFCLKQKYVCVTWRRLLI